MSKLNKEKIRIAVRKNYAEIAKNSLSGCGCSPESCCGDSNGQISESLADKIGYSQDELNSVPDGANLELGCGNPVAIASLKRGQTVLDLGSGAGLDCFLAAQAVGENGKVIGVDMTAEMVSKARKNAAQTGFTNVEFRLGEIEHLPVADNSIDVIISNCVINLSPEKLQVFREAYRVLKKGGRLAISDIVARTKIPEKIKNNLALYTSCVAGASTIMEIETMLLEAGFANIRINVQEKSGQQIISEWILGRRIEDYIVSAYIEAVKP